MFQTYLGHPQRVTDLVDVYIYGILSLVIGRLFMCVMYITSNAMVCACVTFILFVFREQKMVQRMQEIVAKYEDRFRLRKMQSVPRLSYGRRLVCTDGAPKRMFLTCLFCHHVWCRTILIIFRLCLVLFFLLT